MKRLMRGASDWLFQAWWLDYLIVAAGTASAIFFVPTGHTIDLLGHLDLGERRAAYTDLITISALLAGFTSVAFTTYLGWQTKGIRKLQEATGRPLYRLWLVLIAAPWLCALALWLVRVLDRGDVPPENPARWIALAAMLLVIASVLRSVWVFTELLPLSSKDPTPTQQEAPKPIGMKDKAAN